MSCDIHLCVEKRRCKNGWFRGYKQNPDSDEWEKTFCKVSSTSTWSSCAITPDTWYEQHYGMFAKLSNVRNIRVKPIPIKGFPEDASIHTLSKYALRVVPDDAFDKYNDSIISESTAEQWIKNGDSKEITLSYIPFLCGKECKFITHPDYHSPNWCSLQELEESVKEMFFEDEVGYVYGSEEWLALVGYMKGLEMAGFETRCVFWFDN